MAKFPIKKALINNITVLIPVDDTGIDVVKKIKYEDLYQCEVKKPRNYKFLRKFMALVKTAHANQSKYDTIEDVKVEFKLRTGHFKEHITSKGVLIYVPKSISFAKMDEIAFSDFYDKCIDIALKYFCKGSDAETINRKVNEIIRFD